MDYAKIFKVVYAFIVVFWFLLCFFGTAAGLGYHSTRPIASKGLEVLEGIGIAVIPAVLGSQIFA
jgi:hypothetical protein